MYAWDRIHQQTGIHPAQIAFDELEVYSYSAFSREAGSYIAEWIVEHFEALQKEFERLENKGVVIVSTTNYSDFMAFLQSIIPTNEMTRPSVTL